MKWVIKNAFSHKILWWLLFLESLIFATDATATLFNIPLRHNLGFQLFLLSIPIILLILHSIHTLSLKRALIFIVVAGATGLVMEMWGLKDGVIFGGFYTYKSSMPTIYTVPIQVVIYWAVFIYTGYSITNSFLTWLGHKKPSFNHYSLMPVVWLTIFDALLIVIIDLFMDPIQVYLGSWTWSGSGPYFGIPTGNFIGWFIVACISTGIYRTFEYFFPVSPKFHHTVHLIPVLGYGLLALSFASYSLAFGMTKLTLIGLTLMLPVVALNLHLYRNSKSKNTHPSKNDDQVLLQKMFPIKR